MPSKQKSAVEVKVQQSCNTKLVAYPLSQATFPSGDPQLFVSQGLGPVTPIHPSLLPSPPPSSPSLLCCKRRKAGKAWKCPSYIHPGLTNYEERSVIFPCVYIVLTVLFVLHVVPVFSVLCVLLFVLALVLSSLFSLLLSPLFSLFSSSLFFLFSYPLSFHVLPLLSVLSSSLLESKERTGKQRAEGGHEN